MHDLSAQQPVVLHVEVVRVGSVYRNIQFDASAQPDIRLDNVNDGDGIADSLRGALKSARVPQDAAIGSDGEAHHFGADLPHEINPRLVVASDARSVAVVYGPLATTASNAVLQNDSILFVV